MTIVVMAPTGEASRKTPAKVEFMAKAAVATAIDVAAVEEHLARYVVSCPLCKGVGELGVAHDEWQDHLRRGRKGRNLRRRRALQALRLPDGAGLGPDPEESRQAKRQSRLGRKGGRPKATARNRSGSLLHAARIALEPFLGPGTRVDELRRAEATPGLGGPEFAPELVDFLREAGELGRRLGI